MKRIVNICVESHEGMCVSKLGYHKIFTTTETQKENFKNGNDEGRVRYLRFRSSMLVTDVVDEI